MGDVVYRWLEGIEASDEEWQRIDDILAQRGWMALNRETTRIRVAEEAVSGKLMGFLALQLLPHTEPLYLIPEARGQGIAEQLADDMIEFLREVKVRGFMLVADSDYAEKLAKERGLHKLKSPVYTTMDI